MQKNSSSSNQVQPNEGASISELSQAKAIFDAYEWRSKRSIFAQMLNHFSRAISNNEPDAENTLINILTGDIESQVIAMVLWFFSKYNQEFAAKVVDNFLKQNIEKIYKRDMHFISYFIFLIQKLNKSNQQFDVHQILLDIFTKRYPSRNIKLPSFIEETTLSKIIGQGSYGFVYENNKGSVTKVFTQGEEDRTFYYKIKAEETKNFIAEILILPLLQHENIIAIQAYSSIPRAIELEYAKKRSLTNMIIGTSLPISTQLNFAHQIISAVQYMHSQGVLHCDISVGNLLCTDQDKLKLADFGAARFKEDHYDSKCCETTYLYAAPELLARELEHMEKDVSPYRSRMQLSSTDQIPGYTENTDWFAVALTLWAICFRQHPFSGQFTSAQMGNIIYVGKHVAMEGKKPELPSQGTSLWNSLPIFYRAAIEKMSNHELNNRCNPQEITELAQQIQSYKYQ